MAITVTHGKDSIDSWTEAKKWVIDPDGRLHIIGEAGNLASYNVGYWANVAHMEMAQIPSGTCPSECAATQHPGAEHETLNS